MNIEIKRIYTSREYGLLFGIDTSQVLDNRFGKPYAIGNDFSVIHPRMSQEKESDFVKRERLFEAANIYENPGTQKVIDFFILLTNKNKFFSALPLEVVINENTGITAQDGITAIQDGIFEFGEADIGIRKITLAQLSAKYGSNL